jgi:tetratricopeptide (TPR) repeat protein/DNA-binding CsgD family transcriptional regulator
MSKHTHTASERVAGAGERCAQASRELLAARWQNALTLLEGCEDWPAPHVEEATLLKAETLLRCDPINALEQLARTNDLLVSPAARFGYYLTSGKAYANSRNFESAAEMFRSAEEYVAQAGPHADSRLAYQRARLSWLTRDFDPHCGDLAVALRNPDPNAQVMALNVRGWMHAGLEEFERQLDDSVAALRIVAENIDACDLWTVGSLLHATARLAFEMNRDDVVALAERVYDLVPWTDEIKVDRFKTLRSLAWHAFLQGQPARAQWMFKDSKALAPSIPWAVMAHLDRAYVARMSDNELWAVEELAQAHRLSSQVQWGSTVGEERVALVTFALLYASVDMGQAQRYVSTYIALGTENVDPTLAMGTDRRAIGFEKMASGRVHQVLGNTALAVRSYETAYDIFSQMGFHYRAAIAAEGLWQTTHIDSWLAKAREHASHLPNSTVASKLSKSDPSKSSEPFEELTPMQRQLAHALCEGLEMGELSKRFSRSALTVQRQIEDVFARLRVDSRSALRSELERRTAS